MQPELSGLRRRAIGLQQAGLIPYADRAFRAWWAAAQAQESWASGAEAAARAAGLALDRDRPEDALAIGAEAVPKIAGQPYLDPDVVARLYIYLAKAAWRLGRAPEMRTFTGAARSTVEGSPVEPLVRVHFGLVEAIAAQEAGDLQAATAWALQSLDVAQALGSEAAIDLCRQNLSFIWIERGEFDRARAVIGDLLVPTGRDRELVDLLVNGVHIALGQDDLTQAGQLARRAVRAYCEAPSLLSPLSVGFLFEALAAYQAACGSRAAAEMLALTARGWFALPHRQRDVQRIEHWLANLPRLVGTAPAGGTRVDPDLLYLGDLFAAADWAPGGELARALALSVNRLLREVEPGAEATPCEHAALLRPLAPGERWFTGRSALGQAAERVLTGADAAGKAALDLLAAYERLAASGAPWRESIRILRRDGRSPESVLALDRLYREATA
jgi:hypothetical protein